MMSLDFSAGDGFKVNKVTRTKCSVHLVDFLMVDKIAKILAEQGFNDEFDSAHPLPTIADLSQAYPGIKDLLSKGDIIEDISAPYYGYRSNGIWFYSGITIISQSYNNTDYGNPPTDFDGSFPEDYWSGDVTTIDHTPGNTRKRKAYWHLDNK